MGEGELSNKNWIHWQSYYKLLVFKVRQRREWKKEKAFQATLTAEIRDAEKFSAEQYVAEKIRSATEIPIPRFWKGRRLPQFIIKEMLNQEEKKKIQQKYKLWEEYGRQWTSAIRM